MTTAFNTARNSSAQRAPVIYEAYADGIPGLNRRLVSPGMCTFGDGRAYRHDDMGFYASSVHVRTTMEASPHYVLKQPRMQQRFEGQIYIGAAGLLNFTYIAACRPAAAILFDINPLQAMWWNHVLPALAELDDPCEFRAFIVDTKEAFSQQVYTQMGPCKLYTSSWVRLSPEEWKEHPSYHSPSAFRSDHDITASTMDEAADDMLWLASGYEHLHQMAKAGAIGAMTLDVLDAPAWVDLADYMGRAAPYKAPWRAGIAYVSNIFSFIDHVSDWTHIARSNCTPVSAQQAMAQALTPGAAIISHLERQNLSWDFVDARMQYLKRYRPV